MPLEHCALFRGSTTRHITHGELACTAPKHSHIPKARTASTCTPRAALYLRTLHRLDVMQGAWRGRQNAGAALAVVDSFFTSVISGALAHDVQAKDLDLPLHSARTHDLLADNTAAINLSYTVY